MSGIRVLGEYPPLYRPADKQSYDRVEKKIFSVPHVVKATEFSQ